LKKSPEQIARLKEICNGKSICACSDVALALMTEESTQEEGNTLMNGLYERFSGNPQIINENPVDKVTGKISCQQKPIEEVKKIDQSIKIG
jgi:hypothetical protein